MTTKQFELLTITGQEGIAPEILPVALEGVRKAAHRAGYQVKVSECLVGHAAMDAGQDALSDQVVACAREVGLVLKAPLKTPIACGHSSLNVALRKRLALYANVRPVQGLPGIDCLHPTADFVILRENTEGLYSGSETVIEREQDKIVVSSRIISRSACLRIVACAFELALRAPHPELARPKVTLFHKANILKAGDGLFLDCFELVAKEYENRVDVESLIVDNGNAQMILHPNQFHVIVTENMNGDILSDGAAALVGGLGIVGSVNVGDNAIMAEAVHGTADGPHGIAGQGIANPTAIIRATALLFRHLPRALQAAIPAQDARDIADAIDGAIAKMYQEQLSLTGDVGGNAGTAEFAERYLGLL